MESCTSLERAIQGKGQAKQNQVGKTVKHNPKPRKERASPPGSPSRAGFHVHARSDCNGSSWSEKCARFVRLGPAPLECFGAPQAYTVELGHDSPCARICLELNRHTASSPASRDEHANVAAVIRMSKVVTVMVRPILNVFLFEDMHARAKSDLGHVHEVATPTCACTVARGLHVPKKTLA